MTANLQHQLEDVKDAHRSEISKLERKNELEKEDSRSVVEKLRGVTAHLQHQLEDANQIKDALERKSELEKKDSRFTAEDLQNMTSAAGCEGRTRDRS